MADSTGGDAKENTKKRKHSDDEDEDEEIDGSSENIFQDFKLDRVLRQDHKNKMITMLGKFADDEEDKDAVVVLERLPFEVSAHDSLTSDLTRTMEVLKNTIYSTHTIFTPRTLPGEEIRLREPPEWDELPLQQAQALEPLNEDGLVMDPLRDSMIFSTHTVFRPLVTPDTKATMIYPATSKHIEKYSDHAAFIVRETPQLFQTVTQPCLEASQFSIQWVYNILEKKSEADRIVFEDPDPETGFILLPDMKWNRTDLSALYLVAIVHKHGITSLRALSAKHLPLLRNILDKGKAAIQDQFNIPSHKLRVYFHYQPSYNHLHVHFTHVHFDAPGSDCLRAHVLEDVIDNLELDSDFYTKKTLVYTVRENDALYRAYSSVGYFDKA